MVTRKDIERLGDLIKIELGDPEKYIKQVEQILNYFGSLDKVETSSDNILTNEVLLDKLREDKSAAMLYDGKMLLDYLKRDPKQFIRAPKMS